MKRHVPVFGVCILVCIFVVLPARGVFGATFCVTNASDLQVALTAAQSNGEDDTIKVVQGTYNTRGLTYTAVSTENYSLALKGGYTAGCASRVVDIYNTALHGGGGNGPVLFFDVEPGNTGASLSIEGFFIAFGYDVMGGGIRAHLPSSITLTNNGIMGNTGCGVYAVISGSNGSITLTNNTIEANAGQYWAGGVYANVYGTNGSITLTDNTISENTAIGAGGGVHAETNAGSITITDNTIQSNSSARGGGVYVRGANSTTIDNNDIFANVATSVMGGGGVCAEGNSILTLTSNYIGTNATFGGGSGGGVLAIGDSIILTDNYFYRNSCSIVGVGGGVYASGRSISLTSNMVYKNFCNGTGGGVYVSDQGSNSLITLTNNEIAYNITSGSGGRAGGVFASLHYSDSTLKFTNNTVVRNFAVNGALEGGLYLSMYDDNATADVYNNILYANSMEVELGQVVSSDIFNDADADGNLVFSTVNICYNDFVALAGDPPSNSGEGCADVSNYGNIDENPSFVVLPDLLEDPSLRDLHLMCSSFCIDAGYNGAYGIQPLDMDGNPRVVNVVVDMGAYEAHCEDCSDGRDNDGDSLVDCEDPDCDCAPECVPPLTETDCTNMIDDDCDGLVDCEDPDCECNAACIQPDETDCANGIDDDCDGLVDCEDPDCTDDPACATTTTSTTSTTATTVAPTTTTTVVPTTTITTTTTSTTTTTMASTTTTTTTTSSTTTTTLPLPLPPQPDVKANGSDGTLFVTAGTPIDFTLSLDPGSMAGVNTELWIGLMSSLGTFWLDGSLWTRTGTPILLATWNIQSLPAISMLNAPLPQGCWHFLFALDDNVDGIFEMKWFDTVFVVVNP
jgi:hypothetical protein